MQPGVGHIPGPVYAYSASSNDRKFSVPGTPATVMISPDGIIKEIWIGAYSGAAQKKIEATLHVQLPGTTM